MAAPGLEGVLADECRQLGFRGLEPVTGGVEFEGGLAEGMRACLWLRTATTVRLRLGTVPAASASAWSGPWAGSRWRPTSRRPGRCRCRR